MNYIDLRPRFHILHPGRLTAFCGGEKTRVLITVESVPEVDQSIICVDCLRAYLLEWSQNPKLPG